MKAEKYLEFGGKMFELVTAPKKRLSIMRKHCNQEGFWLHDVYETYSYYKEKAWHYWNDFVNDNDCFGLGICSHNTFQFTLSFIGRDFANEYLFYITPNHNYVIKF